MRDRSAGVDRNRPSEIDGERLPHSSTSNPAALDGTGINAAFRNTSAARLHLAADLRP
jgi:hypothetical protein